MGQSTLSGKNVVILGASRGVGRELARRASGEGAQVLAVARGREALDRLAREVEGIRTLAIDASNDDAPDRVFAALRPGVLIVCGGATPATRLPSRPSRPKLRSLTQRRTPVNGYERTVRFPTGSRQ